MSKILKCITLAVVMLLIVTACGPNRSKEDIDKALNKDNSKDKPNQLTMWVDGDKQMAFYKKMTDQYTKKTGIKVKLVNIGQNDQLENISLDAPAGKGPDIFFLAHDNTGSAYLQGLADEIKLSKDELKGFNKQALKAMNYDNKQLALPAIVETTALFYNKKLVKNAPQTLEEVEANAAKLTDSKKKQYGMLFDAKNFYFNYPFLFGNDDYIFKKNGSEYDIHQLGLNSKHVVKNAERLQKWYDKGYLPKVATHDVMIGLFKEGKVGQFVTGPWNINEYQETFGKDLGVSTLPTDGGKPMKPFLGVRGWYLSEYSKHKYWAKDLMLYITSKDTLQKYTDEMSEITGRVDVKSSNPNLKVFEKQARHAEPMPNIPEMRQVWEPMGNASIFISNGKNPKQALDEATNDITQNIKILHPSQNDKKGD
ncbi:extracellular solute-binding protein [Staphylococcus aureus]|uniref:maltodextrin ABC transporter substrate-binding protein n=1 Tax=Staphylococcus aureus TaxID=1280 RepID=UPI001F16DB21|nr:maltodextrin ABC transporter substrate-binding protein [Staphylococcus aureus]MCE5069934.1 extracellular solute-binding protein [Staphylococcus aureus]